MDDNDIESITNIKFPPALTHMYVYFSVKGLLAMAFGVLTVIIILISYIAT